MAKKSFFRERTNARIKKLDPVVVSTPELLDALDDIDPSTQAVHLDTSLVPENFVRQMNGDEQSAARKWLRHGIYLVLPQPRTIEQATNEGEHSYEARRRKFNNLGRIPPHRVAAIGYSTRPIVGTDNRKAIIPFASILEGTRMFGYAENRTGGIDVDPRIKPASDVPDHVLAKRVATEGGTVFTKVPSRTQKQERYGIDFNGIPVVDNLMQYALQWGLHLSFQEGKVPEHDRQTSVRYRFETDPEQSNVIYAGPHVVAARLAIARDFMREHDNPVPWETNPFAKPTQGEAQLDNLIRNNLLVWDEGREAHRRPYFPERSRIHAMNISRLGHDETMFWQAGRDPKLQDYDWTIPGQEE